MVFGSAYIQSRSLLRRVCLNAARTRGRADVHLIRVMCASYPPPSVNSTVSAQLICCLLFPMFQEATFSPGCSHIFLKLKFFMFYMKPKVTGHLSLFRGRDAETQQQQFCVGERSFTQPEHQPARDQSNQDPTLSAPSSSPRKKKRPGICSLH